MNLSELSLAELKDLLTEIPKEIQRRQKAEKAKLLKEIESLAAQRGFALNDVIGAMGGKKSGSTLVAKYRNPENAEQTWAGRGRQPKWVSEFLAKGGSLEQLKA